VCVKIEIMKTYLYDADSLPYLGYWGGCDMKYVSPFDILYMMKFHQKKLIFLIIANNACSLLIGLRVVISVEKNRQSNRLLRSNSI